MRATLKLLGKTLTQVNHQVESARGESAVMRSAKVLAVGLALAATAGLSQAQNVGYGEQQGAAPMTAEQEAQAAQVVANGEAKAKDFWHRAAEGVGGVAGAVVGNNLTKGAGTLWRSVATLGGGVAGALGAGALVPDGDKTRADAQTKVAAAHAAATYNPSYSYQQALDKSFGATTTTGAGVLPPSINRNFQGMLTRLAATRMVAVAALVQCDDAMLLAASKPDDRSLKMTADTLADKQVATFQVFTQATLDTQNMLKIATERGYDVTAQRALFREAVKDIRLQPAIPMTWPGATALAAQIGEHQGIRMNYAQITTDGELATPKVAMRDR